ncbi:hypothetical protein PAXINDRAFT_101349 [Paxillus involutus ATCC 200175]|uniref:DUF6533 domain-containing protein n=1 Tax=Paxillus involutus ATCC 200175 TaxID=664439 RepID=A0A0C9TNM9_PAXIN|nr:hypothetical protein PAXINDRAFT_101349 [Paxillus involutus ATCC 200175]
MSTSESTLLARAQVVKYYRCRFSGTIVDAGADVSSVPVAPAAIWLFDYFLTLEDEVRMMWGSARLSVVHVLFVVVRYLPVAVLVCAAYDSIDPHLEVYRGLAATIVVSTIFAEALLLLRTLALWYNNRWVKAALITLYLLVVTICVAFLTLLLSLNFDSICSTSAKASGSYQAAQSVASSIAKFSAVCSSAAALFELVVLLLTIYHGLSARMAGASTQGRLMNALCQGNLIYASALFVTCIASNVFFLVPISEGFGGLLDVFQGTLHGVLATRILFDLREAGKTGLTEVFSVSNMRFDSIPMHSIREQSHHGAEGVDE